LPLRRLEQGSRIIRKNLGSGRVALMFGSEKRGLLNDEMSHCHWLMRIPTREGLSMNLGQAVAVCLYELIRDAKAPKKVSRSKRASAGDLERITAALFEALAKSGYVNPRTSASTEEKIRRLVRRLELPADDSEVWLGILRQILWKVGQ
jgi:tRNA/rRNA methyltransferase